MRIKKYLSTVMFLILITISSGCKNDELVLVTTESTAAESSEDYLDSQLSELQDGAGGEEDVVKTEATDEEKSITLAQLYNANKGDALLATTSGYSVNTIYYYEGTEVYSEFQFLGFNESGDYFQAYENSDGTLEVLDAKEECWYSYDPSDNAVKVLLYPEEGIYDLRVAYNHDEVIYSPKSQAEESIKEIYRAGGELTIETSYKDANDNEYTFKYIIDENLRILSYECYDISGNMVTYAWTSIDMTYSVPEAISEYMDKDLYRDITINHLDEDREPQIYKIAAELPVQLEFLENIPYLDEKMTSIWQVDESEDGETYLDIELYLKKK